MSVTYLFRNQYNFLMRIY